MLVYYKTPEREKVLNAIKLYRTKQVSMMPQDGDDAVFGIEMEGGQIYFHRSSSKSEGQKWVDALGSCRLAGLEQKKRPGPRRSSVTLSTSPDMDIDETRTSQLALGFEVDSKSDLSIKNITQVDSSI